MYWHYCFYCALCPGFDLHFSKIESKMQTVCSYVTGMRVLSMALRSATRGMMAAARALCMGIVTRVFYGQVLLEATVITSMHG